MTRRDYILIAEALRVTYEDHMRCSHIGTEPSNCAAAVRQAAVRIGDACYKQNPRFDREHFLAVVRGEKELNSRPARKVGV